MYIHNTLCIYVLNMCIYIYVYINTCVGKSTPMTMYCTAVGSLCLCHGNSWNIYIYIYIQIFGSCHFVVSKALCWMASQFYLLRAPPSLPALWPTCLDGCTFVSPSFLLECFDVACLVLLFRTIVCFRSSGLSATSMHVHQLPLKLRRQ